MENDNINKEEALAGLSDIGKINQQAKAAYRGPTWLAVLITLTFSIYVFACCMGNISEVWDSLENIFALTFIGFFLLQYYLVNKTGVKPRMIPTTFKGRLICMSMLISIFTIVFGGEALTSDGYPIAAYISAILTGLIMGYILYKYPSLDVIDTGIK